MSKAYECAHLKPPNYPVVKDLFDQIDARKDGLIDHNEWVTTFGAITEGKGVRGTKLAAWENSREFDRIGAEIAKNRNFIGAAIAKRLEQEGQAGTLFTFE